MLESIEVRIGTDYFDFIRDNSNVAGKNTGFCYMVAMFVRRQLREESMP